MKPSEKIKKYCEERGGRIRSRQVLAVMDFLDDEYEIKKLRDAHSRGTIPVYLSE